MFVLTFFGSESAPKGRESIKYSNTRHRYIYLYLYTATALSRRIYISPLPFLYLYILLGKVSPKPSGAGGVYISCSWGNFSCHRHQIQ